MEKRIFEKLGVKSADELVAYTYNHGNNPQLGIYRKCDVYPTDCTEEEWHRLGGKHPWDILDSSPRIESSEDSANWDLAGIGSFGEVMRFALTLEDASEYVQGKPLMPQGFDYTGLIDVLTQLADTDCKIEIVKEIETNEECATLYHFTCNGAPSACIVIVDPILEDVVFTLRDWQGAYPQTAEEIDQYEWVSGNYPAFNVNGLPRLLV